MVLLSPSCIGLQKLSHRTGSFRGSPHRWEDGSPSEEFSLPFNSLMSSGSGSIALSLLPRFVIERGRKTFSCRFHFHFLLHGAIAQALLSSADAGVADAL